MNKGPKCRGARYSVLSLALVFACLFPVSARDESSMARFERERMLVARHAKSAVTVKMFFSQGDVGACEGFRIPYVCPNCDRIHDYVMSEYAEGNRPLESVGYLVAPDRVLMPDFLIRSNFVDSVSVEYDGASYSAIPVRRYPEQEALELQTVKPVVGAEPLAFKTTGEREGMQFFYSVRENGQTISGVLPAGSLRVRHYADAGKTLVKLPANTIVLDAEGDPVSLSFRAELPFAEFGFRPPGSWRGEAPDLFDGRVDLLRQRLAASLVPVFIHREVENRASHGLRRILVNGIEMDDEAKTDVDTFGYALENGELLVPLEFDATKTAQIDKMEAVLADGSRRPLEYVGSLERYALAVLRFPDGRFPDGIRPLAFRSRPCPDLYLSLVFSVQVRSMDGRLGIDVTPVRVREFETIRGGVSVPDMRLNTSQGRRAFAVSEDGEFVMGRLSARVREAWDSDAEKISAMDLAAFVAQRKFDPEYVLRKGKDRIRVAWIGVETQQLTPELAREKKASGFLAAYHTPGALVRRVYPRTPAAEAGLSAGDVLLYVRRSDEAKKTPFDETDTGIGNLFDLEELLKGLEAEDSLGLGIDDIAPWPDVEGGVNKTFSRFGIGSEIVVALVRNGERREATLKLVQAPVHFRNAKRLKSKGLGAVFAELTFEVRGYFKLADDAPGVIVCKVQPGSPARVSGLRPLEIVTHVDDKPVKTLKEFGELVRGRQSVSLSVRRLEKTRIVRVSPKAPVPSGD